MEYFKKVLILVLGISIVLSSSVAVLAATGDVFLKADNSFYATSTDLILYDDKATPVLLEDYNYIYELNGKYYNVTDLFDAYNKDTINFLTILENNYEPIKKSLIGKSDLPYIIRAKNDMSITINSYTVTNNEIKFNITMTNHSTVYDKGMLMLDTYEVYDGKNTLKLVDMDNSLKDISYLRDGQTVNGNIIFEGLSHNTDTFRLYGKLCQYLDKEEFKIDFKVE